MEVYDDSTYQINAMANALQMETVSGRGLAASYAKKLEATGEFDNCYYAAAHYYLPVRDFEGFFRATRTGVLQEGSNAAAWNSIARLYAQAAVQLEPEDLEEFLDGVVAYRDLLEDFNSSGRMEQIVLEDANRLFLDTAATLAESGAGGEAAAALLNTLFGE